MTPKTRLALTVVAVLTGASVLIDLSSGDPRDPVGPVSAFHELSACNRGERSAGHCARMRDQIDRENAVLAAQAGILAGTAHSRAVQNSVNRGNSERVWRQEASQSRMDTCRSLTRAGRAC